MYISAELKGAIHMNIDNWSFFDKFPLFTGWKYKKISGK